MKNTLPRSVLFLALGILQAFALVVSADIITNDFDLISVRAVGQGSASGASLNPVLSTNGQFVAFVSDAGDLVAGDGNGRRDVFWRNRGTGITRLVSRTLAGASGNAESDSPSISPDGRYVAFHSRASDLVAGDTNANYDVFVWDSQTDTVTLASRTPAGLSGAGDSFAPKLSANGRLVAFLSTAGDLAGLDTNNTSDVFLFNLDTSVMTLVSVNLNNHSGNGSCGVPVMSADGRHVAFLSRASDLVTNDFNALNDVFVRDLQSGVTRLVSVNAAGTRSGNRLSFDPVISADGRFIAFGSQATDLVTLPDTNNFPDVFVRDMQLGVTRLVSVNRLGTASGGDGGVGSVLPASFNPFLSGDGTKVLFTSLAEDLVAGDTNRAQDIFLYDVAAQTTVLISVNKFGTGTGNGLSGVTPQSLSADGRYVAFFSDASDIGAADLNGRTDVFLRDLATNQTKIISRARAGGLAGNGNSYQPAMSADGVTVLFTSEASNLVPNDNNNATDIFTTSSALGAPDFGPVNMALGFTSVSSQTVGTAFSIVLSVTNVSANPATGVRVSLSVPAALNVTSASPSQGSINAGTAIWQIEDLAAGATATLTLTLSPVSLGIAPLNAVVSRLDQPDADQGNNSLTTNIVINRTVTGALFHLPGSTAYLSRTNSPYFAGLLSGAFTLEDFERGGFGQQGVTATAGVVSPPGAATDSVDADDGAVDGFGTAGRSFLIASTNAVTFTFNPARLGRLPTKVGIVLTDGDHEGVGIEAYDTNGVSLGVIGPFEVGDLSSTGETAEDRFLGAEFAGGIAALRVYYPQAGFEVDHLQFDVPTTDLALGAIVPASSTVGANFAVTFTVTNLGPTAVTNATVTNGNPGSVNLVASAASQGSFDGGPGIWTIGSLAVGGTASLTLTLSPTTVGSLSFSARVLGELADRSTNNDAIAATVLVPNQPPTATFVTNLLVLAEDAGLQTLAAFAALSGLELGQAITNSVVTNSNPALFAVQPAIGLGGTLTFTPAANANGSAVVTLVVQDDGGTANGGSDKFTNSFTLTVAAVNDAPSLAFTTNLVVVLEDAGTVTLPGFATAGVGPANESAQAITNFTVRSLTPTLFSVQPAIALDGTLTFRPAADFSGSAVVEVVVQDDGGVDKTTNTFTITVTGVNDPPFFSLSTVAFTVLEDSGPFSALGILISPNGGPREGSQSITNYTVTPSGAAASLFSVQPALTLGGTFTFTPAPNTTGTGVFYVRAFDNGDTANGGTNGSGIIAVTINVNPVNDAPSFTLATNNVAVLESAGLVTLTNFIGNLSLGPADEAAQRVTNYLVVATNASLFVVLPALDTNGTLTFTLAPNSNGVATVSVQALDDGGTANGGTNGSVLTNFTITITPVNEPPSFTLSIASLGVAEDIGLTTFPNLISGLSLGPPDESGQTLLGYTVTNASPGLFAVQPTVDVSGTLTFQGATNATGTILVSVVAQDSGGTAGGGNDRSVQQTFLIILQERNDAPSFVFATNFVTVLEDAGPVTVSGFIASSSVGPVQEVGNQSITNFAVTANDGSLFSVAPAIGTNGVLTFTPAANARGTTTITVVARDNGGTGNGGQQDGTPQNFTITLTAVNDAPSVTFATNNVVVAQDSGARLVAGFATPSFGPADEAGQTVLSYTVTPNSAALFLTAPAISLGGDLTFTPATGASGSTPVTVVARDSGGTADGGVDLATNTFTITITAPGSTNFTWLGGSGDWHNPALWSPAGVPGALDTAGISGGAVQLTNGVTVANLTLSGGTLSGSGGLTIATNLSWTAGMMSGSGGLMISTGATAAVSSGNTKTLARPVDNAGTVTWSGGTVVGNGNPTFNNQAGAVFDIQVDNSFFSTSDSSVRTFNNAGTVRKTAGAGTTSWHGAMNNTGTLAVQVGTLDLTGSGLSSGTFTNAVGSTLSWSSGTHDLTNGVAFTGLGTNRISGGTLDVGAATTVSHTGTFELTSGTLGGAGNFTVPSGSQFNWTAGTVATGGVVTVAAGGSLAISGGNTKTLRRQVNNAGTVTWSGGTVVGNSNPTFNNQAGAVFNIQVDNTFFSTSDSSVRTFNNAGTVRKTAGAGATSWEGILNNAGKVEVAVGTLNFSGAGLSSGTFTNAAGALLAWTSGVHELTNGAAFTGMGTSRISGGTLNVSSGTTVSHTGVFELTSGTLGGAGSFTVPSGSQFNWTAGTVATGGVFTVAAGGSLTISGGSTKTLRRQVNNAGTVTWSGGTVVGNDDPTFNNQAGAVFDIQVDNSFFSTSDSSVRTFNNAGTVRKTAGAGTTTWDGVFNNDGTLSVQTGTMNLVGSGLSSGTFQSTAGSLLTWTTGGTHELTNGVTFIGAGTSRVVAGTLAVSAGAVVSHEGTFELAGGTLGGAGNFTVPAGSQFNWTGGTVGTGGVFTVAAGGTVTISGGATKVLRRQLNNSGMMTWTGGTVQANSSPTFNNLSGGLLDLQTDNTFFATSDSSTRVFNNAGTVRKSAGAGTTVWQDVFNNTGVVQVQTGTLQLTGSGLSAGAFTGASGAVLEWSSGTHLFTNGVTFGVAGTRRVSGATVQVTAGASLSAVGVLEVTGGTLGGAGGITVPADAAFTWTGGALGTGGVFTVAAGGAATFSGGSTKTLRRQFDNQGTVTWTGGQVLGNNNPTFNNQAGAVFDVQADTSFFNSSDSSTPVFNNAGTLRKTAGTGTTTWFGTLNQDGILELRQGTFALGSTYNPGGGGSFTVFLGGLTAGTQFGQLVAGNHLFAGTLNVVLTNGFVPALSNSFHIINGGTGSGVFTNVTGRFVAGGLVLETNYSGGDLTLQALAVNTAPTFALTNFPPTDGVQSWTRDAVSDPGAGRKVAVDSAGNIIVAGDYNAPGGEVSQRDLVVVKYQPDGTLLWSNTVNAVSFFHDQLAGLALDASGNVFLLGSASASTTNFVTVKFLTDGTLDWMRIYDSGGEDVPTAIAVDASGNVVVTGAVPDPMSGPGYTDYVTIKYAANGDTNWISTNSYSTVGSDTPRSVAVDAAGDVYVTGDGSDTDYTFAYSLKLAGATGVPVWTNQFDLAGENSTAEAVRVDGGGNVIVAGTLNDGSGQRYFGVVKYTGAGVVVWTNLYSRNTLDLHVHGLAVDSAGNVIITGNTEVGQNMDFTTVKYLADGTPAWTNHFEGEALGLDHPNAITVNTAGDVYVTGNSDGSLSRDWATVKYTAAGVGVWTNRYDGTGGGNDTPYAVAVDASGNVYVTGAADSAMRTVKYAVVPSLGAGQSVANTVGAVAIPGFVVSSSVGTANESSQTLSFTVTNDNNALFSVQPAISEGGTLTYTVAAGVSGVAVVTVRAQDTGGIANGGVDTSAPQSFNITVGTGASGVAYTWLAAATGNWNDPANWSPNGVPGVADTVTISSGNAQVTNSVAVSGLTLTGGFISGAGSLSIRLAMTWSGGTMIGAGTTTIANGAVLTVNGAADKDLRRRLDNYGTVTWTAGRILGHDAATIYNYAGALFDTQSEATLFESGDGTVKTFNNFGTVRKSAGTGTSEWSGSFNNSGTLNVQTGTLNPSGTVTLNTSSYTGTGQFMLTGATLAGTLTIAAGADVDFASGTLGGTGTIVGTLNWTGGTFGPGGTTTIATNGALVISGATDKDLRHTLDNYGTVTWTGARILGHQGPVIVNRTGALFDAQANTTLFESGDGTIKNFNNSGTVRRTVGTGTTTWNGRFNNDAALRVESGVVALNGGGTSGGTFTNLAGATLEFSDGTHTLNHGTTFTGAGTNLIDGGTVNVSAGATATATGIIGLATGALGGTGTFLVTSGGQFNWAGGAMDGTTGRTVITNGATMVVSTAADKDLQRVLDNYGTVTWTTGRIVGHATPTINNYAGALFDTQTDSSLFDSGDGTIKTFHNFGTVRKSGGTGTSIWNGTFNHSGAADVLTGTLNPDGAVTLGNSSYSGAGRFLITGATLAGTLTIAIGANVELATGAVDGSGTVVGTLNWTSGTLGTGGTLTIATNGALVVSSIADKDLRQTLDNYGTVTWTGGRIVGHNSPVIINRAGAFFNAQAGDTLFESGDGTVKTFNNSGTVRRTVGTGTTLWNGLFNNNAVLRVETGSVALNGGGISGGLFTNLSGTTLEFSGGTHTLNDGTSFAGAGTNLIDGGTVNVSTNATASMAGTFTLASGTLGGTGTFLATAGSQFNWTGGTMDGTTGITIITNGATLIASTGVDKDLRRRLDNYGTVTWTAGRIIGHATPTINNYAGALFDTQVDTTLFDSGDGTIKTFNNAGTLRKSAGTGTTTLHGTFNHSGTANVQTGTLNPDGTVTATAANYSGAGRFLFTTGTLSGTQTAAAGANVELASGTLFGTWTLAGMMNWTGGSLGFGGTTTIPAGSTLLASGTADKDLRRTLNNSGTVLWTGGRLLGHSTPVINNQAGAVFETQVAATLFESGDGTTKTFNNSGTVRKTTSTGTTTFHGTFNNNSALEIQIGVLSLADGYAPAAGSSLKVFLGGLTAGTQFGQLQVSGSTAFAGTLNIVLTNSFTPSEGNSFLIVDSASGSGLFSSLLGDILGGGLSLVPNYLLGDLTLATISNPLNPQSVGTERQLRWPGDSGGYILETATAITGPWTPVLAPVAQENGENVVRLPAEGTRFYRLIAVPPRPSDNPTQ